MIRMFGDKLTQNAYYDLIALSCTHMMSICNGHPQNFDVVTACVN